MSDVFLVLCMTAALITIILHACMGSAKVPFRTLMTMVVAAVTLSAAIVITLIFTLLKALFS